MEARTVYNPDECVHRLGEMIRDIQFAMLTTVGEDGTLHSRPMAVLKTEFSGDLWFFTSRSSGKVLSVEGDHHVNVAFAAPEENRYISIAGQAELLDDRQRAEELWSPIYRAWLPHGLEDPELILIRVQVESAEYWDSPSSKLVQLVGFVKPLPKGKTFRSGEREHVRSDLKDLSH